MNHHNRPLTKVLFFVPTLVVAALLIAAAPVSGQPYTLRHTFDDPTVTSTDLFGYSVALDGDHVLIGAYRDDTHGQNVGQAHLFDATTGSLLRTFDDPTVTDGDHFGYSVAVDGNHIVIGAYEDDTNGPRGGQAHLFDATTGNLLRTFDDPTGTFNDGLGYSVALDGNRVLIGAPWDDTTGANVGQAHLFDATTGNLLRTFDDPTVTSTDLFGCSVALDGDHVLIGAYRDDTHGQNVGQAHLFDATTGSLLRTFDDPTPTEWDLFGGSLALDGNLVLISDAVDDAGWAHLFDATTGNLLRTFDDPTPTGFDEFGASLALDGNRVLIGAPHDSTNGEYVGQAHLFDASTGRLLQTFDDRRPFGHHDFGTSVALDGNRVLIGAHWDSTNGDRVGRAYLFTLSCDFNADAECDIDDLNAMLAEGPIAPGVTVTQGVNDQYDLTGDGVIDLADLDAWLAGAGTIDGFTSPYKRSDANLDGVVDGQDFILWNENKFTSTLLWNVGDWNGDGVADGQDFILWNGNKFTSSDGVSAIPEPGAGILLIAMLISLAAVRQR